MHEGADDGCSLGRGKERWIPEGRRNDGIPLGKEGRLDSGCDDGSRPLREGTVTRRPGTIVVCWGRGQ